MGDKCAIQWTEPSWATRIGLRPEWYAELRRQGLKWCVGCRCWHPNTAFSVERSRWDGLRPICAARASQRSLKRPGTYHRRRLARHGLAWCSDCGAWLRASTVRRSGKCEEHDRAAYRSYYARGGAASIRQRIRARKRGVAPLPVIAQEYLTEQFEGRCAYCGGRAEGWDHVVPVSAAGATVPGNIVPACASCNSSKRDRPLTEWIDRKGLPPLDTLVDVLCLANGGPYAD